jgi:hypothetical protein
LDPFLKKKGHRKIVDRKKIYLTYLIAICKVSNKIHIFHAFVSEIKKMSLAGIEPRLAMERNHKKAQYSTVLYYVCSGV